MTKDKLTPKQSLFVAEYIKTGNATESARRAGYAGNDLTLKQVGSENLAKPYIAQAIEKANIKRDNRLELEADFELKKTLEVLERTMDDNTALRAIELMGKLRGKFIQKIEVEGKLSVASTLAAARHRLSGGGNNGNA